jgi:hypothetical protein
VSVGGEKRASKTERGRLCGGEGRARKAEEIRSEAEQKIKECEEGWYSKSNRSRKEEQEQEYEQHKQKGGRGRV